ncbi:hypothetical protein BDA99DRAFT_493049, partial [Phascolomyces articulosus]
MNQFTGPNVQSEPYMQNFMSLPPEMQSLSAQQPLPTHQLMSQQPQAYGQQAGAGNQMAQMAGNMQRPMMQQQQQQQAQQFRPNFAQQQQAWMAKQQMMLQQQQLQRNNMSMDEQQRRQMLMMQHQQQLQMQKSMSPGTIPPGVSGTAPPVQIPGSSMAPTSAAINNPVTPSPATTTMANGPEKSNKPNNDLNAKRVETVLNMNQELIRLCIVQQQSPQEPDISSYQTRLQSNLTYLATMADISMIKPGEYKKTPTPP